MDGVWISLKFSCMIDWTSVRFFLFCFCFHCCLLRCHHYSNEYVNYFCCYNTNRHESTLASLLLLLDKIKTTTRSTTTTTQTKMDLLKINKNKKKKDERKSTAILVYNVMCSGVVLLSLSHTLSLFFSHNFSDHWNWLFCYLLLLLLLLLFLLLFFGWNRVSWIESRRMKQQEQHQMRANKASKQASKQATTKPISPSLRFKFVFLLFSCYIYVRFARALTYPMCWRWRRLLLFGFLRLLYLLLL